MPSPQSSGESFYLTNAKDTPPIIHALLEPASRIWQYVVVDPSTLHGVIIDPICSPTDAREGSSNESSEEIIRLVESRGYLIDHIFETQSTLGPKLTAAWTLRMHFSQLQGYAPQLCSNQSVSALHRSFARKYGASNGFSTTLSNQHGDKESFLVGRMRVTVMHVPGFGTPNRRAYLIDGAIFGAHSIALPSRENVEFQSERSDPVLSGAKLDDNRRTLWKSMNRVLALSPDTGVFYEEYSESVGTTNCTSIEQCRALNPYTGLNDNEFIVRRRGELRELQDAASASPHHKKKRFRQSEGRGSVSAK